MSYELRVINNFYLKHRDDNEVSEIHFLEVCSYGSDEERAEVRIGKAKRILVHVPGTSSLKSKISQAFGAK